MFSDGVGSKEPRSPDRLINDTVVATCFGKAVNAQQRQNNGSFNTRLVKTERLDGTVRINHSKS